MFEHQEKLAKNNLLSRLAPTQKSTVHVCLFPLSHVGVYR